MANNARKRTQEEWAAWEKLIKAKDKLWREYKKNAGAIEDEYRADLAKLKKSKEPRK